MRKEKKKLIFLTDFYIFYKSGIKNFSKQLINKCLGPIIIRFGKVTMSRLET